MYHKKKTTNTVDKNLLNRFLSSVWLFPVLLFLLVALLTAFKISGTSSGIYYPILYGESLKDPDLLFGDPAGIRSDEWLFVTQLTIAQKEAGFPRVNQNMGTGKDMSLVGDAPYKDWSAIFRPQNLAFFVLPLEYAFAFKWWLLLYLVIVSCYFFALRILVSKRLVSSIIATAVGLTPFLFWWYQTATFAPVFYGLFIMILGMRIFNDEPISWILKRPLYYSQIIYTLLLAYLLTCFALILYPPFQIPVALVVFGFLLGYFLEKFGFTKKIFSKTALKQVGIYVSALVLTGVLVFSFINTRASAVQAVENTVYPGTRHELSGGTPAVRVFSAYLQPQLQRDWRAAHNYYDNQSESSSFVLFLPFLLVPGFLLIWLCYKQQREISWTLLFVQLISVLFLMNILLHGLNPVYKLLFLDKVPHNRLMIGLGFAGVVQLLLCIKLLDSLKFSRRTVNIAALLYSGLCFIVLILAGLSVRTHYPAFISSMALILFLAIWFSSILFCILSRRFLIGTSVFLLLSVVSVAKIHPIYIGLGPIYPSKLTQTIDETSHKSDMWVVLDNMQFENTALMSGHDTLSGIQPYPDVKFWRQVSGNKASDAVYNRYAHVVFSTDPSMKENIDLVQQDIFRVKFSCSDFIRSNVDYALSTHTLNIECANLVRQVNYPALKFYIYRVN